MGANQVADELNWRSSDIAAWVQAVGSMGAIIGAIFIFREEQETRNINEANQKTERADRVQVIISGIAEYGTISARAVVTEAKVQGFDSTDMTGMYHHYVAEVCAAEADLARIWIGDMDDPIARESYLMLRFSLKAFIREANSLMQSNSRLHQILGISSLEYLADQIKA